MGLKHSISQLQKLAETTRSEITFSDRLGIDWYWEGLRFQPEPDDIPRLVDALKTLKEIGFTNT